MCAILKTCSPISIIPITVRLPNANVIHTNYVGTVFFNNDFYLIDVLYIPNICTNLISIPKLTKHLQCQIIFDSHQCFIQGIHTLRRIGAADLVHGLYVLIHPTLDTSLHQFSHVNSVYVRNSHLWHQRLGHPCNESLLRINKNFPCLILPNPSPLVMLACLLNRGVSLFLIALFLPLNPWTLFTWIFGVLSPLLPCKVIGI